MAEIITAATELLLSFSAAGTTGTDLTAKQYTIGALFDRLSQPKVGTKNGSYYLRGGDLLEPKRADANLRSAELIILDGDSHIDPETGEVIPGAPPLDHVCDVLDSLGITYCAHTTYSHDPDTRLWKYRVIIPAKVPDQATLVACLDDIFATLHKRGVWLNNVIENSKWAQLWFLPRVRDQAALDAFYVRSNLGGWAYDVPRAVARAAMLADREAEIIQAIAKPVPQPTKQFENYSVGQAVSIIETFNKAHGLDWVRETLEAHGYRFAFNRDSTYRYVAPNSETGDAGVVVFKGAQGDWCCYSHHGAHDPLHGRLTDPFDLFAIFEHGGDRKAAARSLGQPDRMPAILKAARQFNAAPKLSIVPPAEPNVNFSAQVVGQEQPIAGADESLVRFDLFNPPAEADLPPRQWIYGRHLIRKFVSVTVAPGGLGKSSLLIGDAIAMATGKPIMGQAVYGKSRVCLWNLEDPLEELQRRFLAAMKFHGVTQSDLGDRLFVMSGRDQSLCTAIMGRSGGPEVVLPVVDAVVAEMLRRQVDALLLDPFISTHQVSENDNNAMDLVSKSWGHVAQRANAALGLVHHSRKQMEGAQMTAESARGGKALTDAAREVRVLNRMTQEEAGKAGVENNRLFFRVYSDKQNMAPPAERSTWFKVHDVALANGDQVGVVAPWAWPDAFDGISTGDLRRVQTAIDAGTYRADPRADLWAGNVVMRVLGIDSAAPASKAKARLLLVGWIKSGALVQESETDPQSRKSVTVVRVGDWAIEGEL